MHTPFSRHGQNGDPSRQQYVPPPPPPPLTSPTPGQPGLSIPIPPPPSRPYPGATTPSATRPPGPPGAWHSQWSRQATYPPPPPLPPNNGQFASYNPAFYNQVSGVNLSSPPTSDNQPLTSATYIPIVGSFGPGVGIPALNPGSAPRYPTDSSFGLPLGHDGGRPDVNGTQGNPNSLYTLDTTIGNNHNNDHSSPYSRPLFDPGSAQPGKPHSQPTTAAPIHRHLDPNSLSAPSSASDPARSWSLERVMTWLTINRFSNDWRETFKELDMHNAQFLELGSKSNVGMMHTKVFPQLAAQCKKSGTGWDQKREREEAKRLRQLIRGIVEHERGTTSKPPSTRRTSVLHGGANHETLAERPQVGRGGDEKLSTPSTAEDGEDSPGHRMPSSTASPSITTTIGSGRYLHAKQESTDAGGRTFFNDSESRPVSELPATRNRSSSSRDALASVSPALGKRRSRADSTRAPFEKSPQASPPLRQSRLPGSGTPATTTSTSTGRYYNDHPGFSSDTNLANGHSAYPATAQAFGLENLNSIEVPPDGRRNASNGRRPSVADSHGRNLSNDGPSSAKEHRGFLPKFLRRKKDEDHISHDDGHSQSPSSPVSLRHQPPNPPFARSNNHSRDTSMDRPSSGPRVTEVEKTQTLAPTSLASIFPRRYMFLTPDAWNYRLVDVSGVDSAETLGRLICKELGIQDPRDLSIFITSPGQIEHNESLPDFLWMETLQRADANGALKIYVRTPDNVPMSAGSIAGPAITASTTASPAALYAPSPRHTDEETLSFLTGRSDGFPTDFAHGPRPTNDWNHTKAKADAAVTNVTSETERDRRAKLEVARQEHRQDIERKQKAYHEKRASRLLTGSEGTSTPGFGTHRVIDFDAPRETLVPLRRPPPVPSETSTLRIANSLKKKKIDPLRRSWSDMQDLESKERPRPEGRLSSYGNNLNKVNGGGFAEALEGATRTGMGIAQPIVPKSGMELERPLARSGSHMARSTAGFNLNRGTSGVGTTRISPRSPGFTMSKGGEFFRIPEYDEIFSKEPLPEEPAPHTKVPPERKERADPRSFSKRQESSTSTKSSATMITPKSANQAPLKMLKRMSTRKSHGPLLDFKEQPISFEDTSPIMSEDSESDDGLFAVPLSVQNGKSVSPIDGQPKRREKPSLSLRTPRSSKGLSVHFPESPNGLANPRAASTESKAQGLNESIVPDSANPDSVTPESPDDVVKAFRRQSFASDIWANRPPVEAVVENLDDFFPNVDLDQPMLAEGAASPPPTPGLEAGVQSTLQGPFDDFTPLPQNVNSSEESDLSELESAMAKKGIRSVASRNMQRASGLGRAKSIRDVAKGVYGQVGDSRKSSLAGPSRVSTFKQSDNILRRKSTKMFGARIEQIKPDRRSRLFNLETIPQDTLPTAPKRQATFKWMKGQLIGKGTFGRVYLGMNTTTGHLLAVKQVEIPQRQVNANGADKDKMKEMVKAMDLEIDNMQDLEHPHIVNYLGCERKEYSISIFLEYIDGGSVGTCLRRHGKFEEPLVSSLTRQTLNALAYLHHKGILHRDLKADNILLTTEGTCKISDFGISKKSDNIYGNDVTNSMQGSVFWMAPEVVRSQGKGYSAKVDIWSIGCVVLEMFAGKRPWSREEAVGAIYKLGSLNEPPPIPDDVSEKISPAALSFMLDCFNVEPGERPTADTLLGSQFAWPDPNYSFYDTELYQKIKPHDPR
ncbi:MAG: hypothetical protein M1828_003862 [Chrysothrix sp. TS-e1954]|nr:MAG: hypothetical protein M1828_003862 [Chrysothrix sp. TS-e1954]